MFLESQHKDKNQKNYSTSAKVHDEWKIGSTLTLAYRDLPSLLEKHLFSRNQKKSFRMLDFGCGSGQSTKIISDIIIHAGFDVDITGLDINSANLELAKFKIPGASFNRITKSAELSSFGLFDLIICNFVLLEQSGHEMQKTLGRLRPLLNHDGVMIVTNCTSKVYNQKAKWYAINSDFPENKPQGNTLKNGIMKPKLKDDQPVKLEINLLSGNQFSFFDFFHSGKQYRKAYRNIGLSLVETHKPLGEKEDGIPWKSEWKHSPYKIHILYPSPSTKNSIAFTTPTIIKSKL